MKKSEITVKGKNAGEIKPNATGYWWAEKDDGKTKCFEVMKTGNNIRVFHGAWWTVEHIEESFKIKRWLGQALPPKSK